MEALSKTKSLLLYAFLYRQSTLKIGFVSIPNAIFNIIYILPMIATVSLMIFNMYISVKSGGDLKEISNAIYLSMGAMSAVFIYVCFAFKKEFIVSLIHQTQVIVKNRMFAANFF